MAAPLAVVYHEEMLEHRPPGLQPDLHTTMPESDREIPALRRSPTGLPAVRTGTLCR